MLAHGNASLTGADHQRVDFLNRHVEAFLSSVKLAPGVLPALPASA
jgi:hypothetical protein